jgi:hypothetical protein
MVALQQMGASLRTIPNLPFEHYALIYYDNVGKIEVVESTSIREQNCSVITPDVRERFREILGPRIGYHKPLLRRMYCKETSLTYLVTLAYGEP